MTIKIDRRKFLKASLVAGGGAFGGLTSFEERALSAEIERRERTGPSPAMPSPPIEIPKGRIKGLEISRLIGGGNLMGGWAHSRDLLYVSPLVKAYHTDKKVLETLRLAEERGVNTFLTNPVSARLINAYRKSGGRLLWISDCAAGGLIESIKGSIDLGADAVYVQGGICDQLVRDGRMKELEKAVAFMKDQLVPCGLGAHSLETLRRCVEAGFDPDFWVKTLHRDDYWSATPAAKRGLFDEVSGFKTDHDLHHDNMWCRDARETIEFMAGVKKPWIAFKVLAAGAIHPRDAFAWCFENGADFLCVGMFDFQVVEDTEIALEALRAVSKRTRPRPWMA